ncbi:uncharacterized protein LOC142786442 isoform X3 [Rhipicephalus microplus]|uniref:uncharacterized protein LOC142786442 isoform X3 n=1 Tax=Rhipicephalus microplus TaxID=6941 RepID=UPI003F6AE879
MLETMLGAACLTHLQATSVHEETNVHYCVACTLDYRLCCSSKLSPKLKVPVLRFKMSMEPSSLDQKRVLQHASYRSAHFCLIRSTSVWQRVRKGGLKDSWRHTCECEKHSQELLCIQCCDAAAKGLPSPPSQLIRGTYGF